MANFPRSLQRVVLACRVANLAEGTCLGVAAFAVVGFAAFGDGIAPLASGTVVAGTAAFAATMAAFLRTRWDSPECALRRADRIAQAQDRLATQHSLLGRAGALSGLEALCLKESERWAEERGAISFRSFFRPIYLLAPLIAMGLLGLIALAPRAGWSGQESMPSIRESLRSVAGEMAREGTPAAKLLAEKLEAIHEALGDAKAPGEVLAKIRALHEEILQKPSLDSAASGDASSRSEVPPELAQRTLSALEKAMIAASTRSNPEAGPTAGAGHDRAASSGSPSGDVEGLRTSRNSTEGPAAGASAGKVETRISAAYSVPVRFEPVVRRYFASRVPGDERPR